MNDYTPGNQAASVEPYRAAGVDLHRAEAVVDIARAAAKRTPRLTSISHIGGFSGAFTLPSGYLQPVMLSACDGVGTKLKLAELTGIHHTVGQDLVAMSVNDILVNGGQPLAFLDYVATGRIQPEQLSAILQGVADGCIEAGCTLLGGETAEMPGMYPGDSYDLAGFAVGVVEQAAMLPKLSEVKAGDCIIGLASSGFHSNGYSLVRKVLMEAYGETGMAEALSNSFDNNETLADALMAPTRIYVQPILKLLADCPGVIKAMVHVTGGGFYDNIPRILPEHLGVVLEQWRLPLVFRWLQDLGGISNEAMWHTFNCGYGFLLIVNGEAADSICQQLPREWSSIIIGHVVDKAAMPAADQRVVIR